MRVDALKFSLTILLFAAPAMPNAAFAQAAPEHSLPPPCQAQQEFSRAAEAIIARQINAARAKLVPGAPALKPDEQLSRIAELRSCELVLARKPLSHLDDKGHFESADMVYSLLGPYGRVAENLMQMNMPAATEPLDAETFAIRAADLWLKSPEHRDNLTFADYDRTGIGAAVNGDTVYVTALFALDLDVGAQPVPKSP